MNAETVSITPTVGQVWKDNDPRRGCTFRIVGVDGRYATVTDLNGHRTRRILLLRLRPGKWGYSLLGNGGSGAHQAA